MSKPWFGRLRSVDHRDRLLQVDKKAAEGIKRRYWGYPSPILDQGPTSMCVGYSSYEYLVARPVCNKPSFTPHDLYKGAQDNDEWPGNDYDGSSVRGAFKWLKQKGLVGEYRWAKDIEATVVHLLTKGPVVVGTDWFEKMDDPDRHGYLWPEGGEPAGHAWLLIGADRERKNPDGTRGAVRMLNSWGADWGDKGRAWLTFEAMHQLITNDGEAAVATEIKV